jgi:hypothetical protein
MGRSSGAVSWCWYHQKLLYTSRKRARVAARAHPEHKSPYPCTEVPTLWHIGGLPDEVRRGDMTRDQFFGKSAS